MDIVHHICTSKHSLNNCIREAKEEKNSITAFNWLYPSSYNTALNAAKVQEIEHMSMREREREIWGLGGDLNMANLDTQDSIACLLLHGIGMSSLVQVFVHF